MIVVFSSNVKGAMIQMAIKVTEELLQMGIDVKCFIPQDATGYIPERITHSIIRYIKKKSIFPYNHYAMLVANQIMKFGPNLIWYIDNGTFSSQVGILLSGKTTQAIVMHDAGTVHASYSTSIRQKIKLFIEKKTSELCNKMIDWTITCSPSSKDIYCNLYPTHSSKVYVLPLGAHLPESTAISPPEIEGITDYNLFFGKIDKYKGIDTLLRSYTKWKGERRLIIAGDGHLQKEELDIIKKDHRIFLINRFIKDEEMPFLFANARTVILPYKEATQSGVLPIAYMCGKPVICSDVIGISQFVQDGNTGYVCKTDESYIDAFERLEDNLLLTSFSEKAQQYYVNYLDWRNNIKKMLTKFNYEA